MKWVKQGRLFEPPTVLNWMSTHAAVPTTEWLYGSMFRVYFSGRDTLGRSQIGFFDFDIQKPHNIINISATPILTSGGLGLFDEHGVMISWIVNHQRHKYLYYIGWNIGASVPFRNAIGLAISEDDGKTFHKYARGPILDRGIFDPCFTASACILIEGDVWRMWYLSCIAWEQGLSGLRHRYHIKYAESYDGIEWKRTGITCIDFQNDSEYAISRPCVIKDGDTYKMWYSCRGTSYRIGYAESLDGIRWNRYDDQVGIDVSSAGWDSEMIEYPFVFDHDGQRYMLYNGNGYGATGIGLAMLDTSAMTTPL